MREFVISTDSTASLPEDYLKENNIAIHPLHYYIDEEETTRKEGNIYVGVVKDIIKGMQAAFVDIGTEKNSFIHLKDILNKVDETKGQEQQTEEINKVLKKGQKLLVQVKKDSNLQKGARVSTNISLPGRFVVLLPDTNFITISKKITDLNKRKELQKIVQEELPKNYGAIVRTSAENKDIEFIKRDIKSLVKLWELIQENFTNIKKEKNNSSKTISKSK